MERREARWEGEECDILPDCSGRQESRFIQEEPKSSFTCTEASFPQPIAELSQYWQSTKSQSIQPGFCSPKTSLIDHLVFCPSTSPCASSSDVKVRWMAELFNLAARSNPGPYEPTSTNSVRLGTVKVKRANEAESVSLATRLCEFDEGRVRADSRISGLPLDEACGKNDVVHERILVNHATGVVPGAAERARSG